MTKITAPLAILCWLWTLLNNFTWATDPLPADYFQGEFDLQSFHFQLTDKLGRDVQCQKSEVKDGLEELVFFGTMATPGRRLGPSKHPLRRDAAWLIHPSGCSDLRPEFNGIGFASLDITTGEAQIYLGYFEKVEITDDEWVNLPSADKMRLFFQPDYTLSNMVIFTAHCTYRTKTIWNKVVDLSWSGPSKNLDCTLTDGRGVVRLRRR